MKYESVPVVVDAVQQQGVAGHITELGNGKGHVTTVNVGDWIVTDANGVRTILTDKEFRERYREIVNYKAKIAALEAELLAIPRPRTRNPYPLDVSQPPIERPRVWWTDPTSPVHPIGPVCNTGDSQ